jgi:hypothetical protein
LNLKFAEEEKGQVSESSDEVEEGEVKEEEKKEEKAEKDKEKVLEVDYYSFRKYLPKRVH